MPLLPVVALHQDALARAPQFTNWSTLWNWLRSLATHRGQQVSVVLDQRRTRQELEPSRDACMGQRRGEGGGDRKDARVVGRLLRGGGPLARPLEDVARRDRGHRLLRACAQ